MLIESPHGHARFEQARRWLLARAAAERVLVLAASLEAASNLLRAVVSEKRAVFGWQHESLTSLAARLATFPLAERGLVPAGTLALEALCVRVVAELGARNELGRLAEVADRPGLARALRRTFNDLGMAGVEAENIPNELGTAYALFRELLGAAGLADRALVFGTAIRAVQERRDGVVSLATCFYDVPATTRLERDLLRAVAQRASTYLATVPARDALARAAFDGHFDTVQDFTPGSLARLQAQLFATGVTEGAADGQVVLLSAPGEARECVELARRVLSEAERGVPFDRMAILLRTPEQYRLHLVEALRRAGIPAHFSRGSVRPDSSGRALLALLGCAAEGLSVSRFAEYLSLAVVPPRTQTGAPPAATPAAERFVLAEHELALPPERDAEVNVDADEADAATDSERAPRVPRRWEALLVDAAVIGGLDRWRRRLSGLARSLELQASRLTEEDAARRSLLQQRDDLTDLSAYALPLIETLAALPSSANWGDWLDALGALASRALAEPKPVLAVLAELEPIRNVGPVGLPEVQVVLQQWLGEVTLPRRVFRGGELVVAGIEEARGRVFDVVFVPGLAEKMLPQRVVEDPLLLDEQRRAISPDLIVQEQRIAAERLALSLAVGAAKTRVVLSYPRFESEKARPRVPSFYALEALRAAEGRLPSFAELARRADSESHTRMGWPAPREAQRAIDAAEYDLAVLREFQKGSLEQRQGAARYLMSANPRLARALRFRARRWHKKWWPVDGLVDPNERGGQALAARVAQLSERGFAVTALERYAACPYRFYLGTVVGLRERVTPAELELLDPATRGLLFHEVLRAAGSELSRRGWLPLQEHNRAQAHALLEEVFDRVVADYEDELAPAIDRVWRDAVAEVRADARQWLRHLGEDGWLPTFFELGFGLKHPESDPESREQPVRLNFGLTLRGSIDVVERSGQRIRATDYKTGEARKGAPFVDGGTFLQPLFYTLVLESLFSGLQAASGRAYYCTARGQFRSVEVPLDERSRAAAARLHAIIKEALNHGFFPAAPAADACSSCDFQRVCGPYEAERSKTKRDRTRLELLEELRSLK